MKTITLKLSSNLTYPIYVIAIMSLFSFLRGCSQTKNIKKLQAETSELSILVDDIYNKDEVDMRLELEGLRTSKRTLYDWNAVIRTTVRPDDRMNEYDVEIKELQNNLSK